MQIKNLIKEVKDRESQDGMQTITNASDCITNVWKASPPFPSSKLRMKVNLAKNLRCRSCLAADSPLPFTGLCAWLVPLSFNEMIFAVELISIARGGAFISCSLP